MALRLTGMYSGLDTDSIISQLMKAQRTKVDAVEKKKTKLEWKVEAWNSLNSKLYSLYTGTVNNLRFTTAYANKATTVSDSNVATITASSSAITGTQELAVKQLAKSGYLTGAKISSSDNTKLTENSTLSQLTGYTASGTGTIQVTTGAGTTTNIEVSATTKISEVLTKLKAAGVGASFDATNQRIFVNSKTSGADANFIITSSDADGENALGALGLDTDKGAVKIEGQDAKLVLNGAEFTSSSNSFSINGLSILAKQTTGTTTDVDGNTVDKTVTISTERDYQGMYDTIKNFITQYNEIIKAMDGAYNADSAKGYEPLTDEEKEAMTEDQIKKWESKIKDSILRRDDTLSSVTSMMKTAMQSVYTINGQKYSLSSFGIDTASYFSTDADEKGVYHIDGNSEDSTTSSKSNKLMSAITSDPESVVSFFTSLTKDLYTKLGTKYKFIDGIRSSDKVYDDKLMDSQIDDYEDEIKKLEKKFTAMEDRYYSQFSAMETALAKLQKNSSALAGLLGSSS